MYFNSIINEKTVKESTFSQRFKYFFSKKNQELKKKRKATLTYSSLGNQIGYSEASIKDFLYRNKTLKDKNALEKLSKILGIPAIMLQQDTTRFWRAISKAEHIANGKDFIDKIEVKKGKVNIYGAFDIKDYNSFIAAKEEFEAEQLEDSDKDELICDIKKIFNAADLFDCFKLSNYFENFIKIHDNAWTFIVNFSLLNSTGKSKIKKILFQNETSIDHQMLIFNKIKVLYDNRTMLVETVNELFEKAKTIQPCEEIHRNNLWEKLETKLRLTNWFDLERFSRQAEHIAKMDFEDWTMLIGYFSLNTEFDYKPSENQKKILSISKKLIRDKQYCDEADFIIENY